MYTPAFFVKAPFLFLPAALLGYAAYQLVKTQITQHY